MDNELNELLNQIIANQLVIFEKLRVLSGESKTTPKKWIAEELSEKSNEFKNILRILHDTDNRNT